MADADRCVMCGEIIPEGSHICVQCRKMEGKPQKCEPISVCPRPVGVACWEQYLKLHEEERE